LYLHDLMNPAARNPFLSLHLTAPNRMSMFKARITVTLRPSILDPQGKASQHALTELGFDAVAQVRIGKFIEMDIEASSADEARSIAEQASDQLLANPVMEDFQIEIEEAVNA